jgi:hypothetical protein
MTSERTPGLSRATMRAARVSAHAAAWGNFPKSGAVGEGGAAAPGGGGAPPEGGGAAPEGGGAAPGGGGAAPGGGGAGVGCCARMPSRNSCIRAPRPGPLPTSATAGGGVTAWAAVGLATPGGGAGDGVGCRALRDQTAGVTTTLVAVSSPRRTSTNSACGNCRRSSGRS